MTEDELLECPFCGSKIVECYLFDEDEDGEEWIVECKNPGCHAKRNVTFWSRKLAIRHWNSRVFPPWLREKIVKERDIFESEISKQSHPYDTHTDRKCVASAQLLWVLSLTPGDNP